MPAEIFSKAERSDPGRMSSNFAATSKATGAKRNGLRPITLQELWRQGTESEMPRAVLYARQPKHEALVDQRYSLSAHHNSILFCTAEELENAMFSASIRQARRSSWSKTQTIPKAKA